MRPTNRGTSRRNKAARVVPLLVLIASSSATANQPPPSGAADVVVLSPESLAAGIVLRDDWRFHAGDDPLWSEPTFDDSGWRRVDSASGNFGPGWEGIGWLRRRLRVASTDAEMVIGLSVHQAGASEVYLDGRQVVTLGKVSADVRRETAWDPPLPVAIVVEPGREHLLSVRFSLAHGHELKHGLRGVVVKLGDLQAMMRAATAPLRRLVPFMAGAAGLAGALALVHGLLLLFDRRAREHLYFSAFAGFLALDVFADMMTNLTADFDARLLWFRLSATFLVAMLLAGIQLELVLFERRRGRVFWSLVAAGGAMVAWVWWIPAFREIHLLLVFMVLALAEMLRLAVRELARGRPDSVMVAAGLIIFALSFFDFFTGYFGLHLPAGIFVIVGWGAPVLALSLFIARRASRTSRELSRRLDEVDTLTRRTIDQERRAVNERAERRVLEADNARKTGELEDARALQLAMLPYEPPKLAEADVAFLMRTATEVGGDYYDYVTDTAGRCVIAVGDATGHGMHAGMVVAVAKSLFATLAPTHDPVRVLHETSRRLAGLRRRGATMALALVRIDGRRLEIAGAAMPPVLIWRRAERTVEEVALSALPVGIHSDSEYPRHTREMAPGDAAFLFTDGLAEVLDPAGDPFGYTRVVDAFARAADHGCECIVQALLDEAQHHASGQALTDDVTLVAIRAQGTTTSNGTGRVPSGGTG